MTTCLPTTDAVTRMDRALLAECIGLEPAEARQADEALGRLLDDDWDLADPSSREALTRSVMAHGGWPAGWTCCGVCERVGLPWFRPEDSRCRDCGELLAPDPNTESARANSESAPRLRISELPRDVPSFAERRELEPALLELPEGGQTLILSDLDAPLIESYVDDSETELVAASRPSAGSASGPTKAELEALLNKAREQARDEAKAEFEATLAAEREAMKAAMAEAIAAAREEAMAAVREELAAERAELERLRESLAADSQRRGEALIAEQESLREEARRGEDAALAALEEERRRREEAERLRQEELARVRPALGVVVGTGAGRIASIPVVPAEGAGAATAIFLTSEAKDAGARLYVRDLPAKVNGVVREPGEEVDLRPGSAVRIGEELFVIETRVELGEQVAEAIHFVRQDDAPGGPWPYWNQTLTIGAAADCGVQLFDDGVDDQHARVVTRFGRVVMEDVSGDDCDGGLWVSGERRAWVELTAGVTIRLGQSGPQLRIGKGEAKTKTVAKARAMKPSRHKRTFLEVRDEYGDVSRRVFVFTRREVRFGSQAYDAGNRMINEWTLTPDAGDRNEIGVKQGALVLSSDTVDLRCDGGAPMALDGVDLERGVPQPLRRGFEVSIGETFQFEGRVYRSPTSVTAAGGPPRLGMKGGHPCECVRLDRRGSDESAVFLVRMLRIGSEASAPLRIEAEGVKESHCRILFSRGKFLIVAPRSDAPVRLGDVEMDPGAVFPLEINTEIHIGKASLTFRELDDDDFLSEEVRLAAELAGADPVIESDPEMNAAG